MEQTWPPKVANVAAAGVLIVGFSGENGGTPAVLLGGRFYTGRQVYEYTDFGGGLDKADNRQPHLAAFREFVEEYFGLSEVGCVPHGSKHCEVCRRDAQSLAQTLWDAARDSIVGVTPVVHTGTYASFVVPAEAVVPVLQSYGRLPSEAAPATAIDTLFSAAKRNPELTSVALVSIEELLSVGVREGRDRHVEPLAVRSLDGVQRSTEKIALRNCMVGRGGTGLIALSSRLEEFQQRSLCAAPAPTVPCVRSDRLPIVFDMETGDPDDVLTLLFLAAHAAVDLKAVTVTPGSHFQVSMIRWILLEVGLPGVRVGAQDWPKNKNANPPEGRFYNNFKHLATSDNECENARHVLLECCDKNTTLLTGGPLTNLAAALSHDDFELGRWVAQGGFAGEGVVPRESQKLFKGMTYCRTTNFGMNPRATHQALRSKSIDRRVFVSKNVCHQTLYADGADGWHAAVLVALRESTGRPGRRRALELMHKAMSKYLAGGHKGKKIHDPLALAVALDESVCNLAEVELGSQGPKNDQWGCWLCEGSRTWISVDYDETKFRRTLLQDGFVPQAVNEKAKKANRDEKAAPVDSGFSNNEKLVLKLAKKLREIIKLEESMASGAALEKTQQEKMITKEDVQARFIDAVQTLPGVSDVIETVSDLIPATQHFAETWKSLDDVATSGDGLPAVQQLAVDQIEVDIEVQSKACDGIFAGSDMELQEGSAPGRTGDQPANSSRRWKKCGGRSGFRRQFDGGFVRKH